MSKATTRKRRDRYGRPIRKPSAGPACRLCLVKSASRPRGLCWVCYYTRRDEVPMTDSPHARRGNGVGVADNPCRPPAEPTAALPGTDAKVAVMAARAARGEAVFHAEDARHDVR